MKATGIRELKAHLSRYLRDVEAGEVVLVTDRGRVVAELRKPSVGTTHVSPIERSLMALAERGELRIGDPRRTAPPQPAVSVEMAKLDSWLADLRDDRR